MDEVLEHQDKPREFLEMVKGLLKEGGYIAGSVPNRERFLREIYWKISRADHPSHHFLRFSRKSLENAIKLFGFEDPNVFAILTYDEHPYVEMKIFGKLYELRNLVKGLVLGDKRKATAYVDDIAASSTSYSEKIRAYALKGIKLMRNALLFSFSFWYMKKAQQRGPHLYFQAKSPMINHVPNSMISTGDYIGAKAGIPLFNILILSKNAAETIQKYFDWNQYAKFIFENFTGGKT